MQPSSFFFFFFPLSAALTLTLPLSRQPSAREWVFFVVFFVIHSFIYLFRILSTDGREGIKRDGVIKSLT